MLILRLYNCNSIYFYKQANSVSILNSIYNKPITPTTAVGSNPY